MPIQVFRDPVLLTPHHFVSTNGPLRDPHDNTPVDAVTATSFYRFIEGKKIGPGHFLTGAGKMKSPSDLFSLIADNFEAEQSRDKSKDGFFGIDPAKTIIIVTGHGERLPHVSVTGNLLAHEQIHYDIYFLAVQAAVRAIEGMAEVSKATFVKKAEAEWDARLVSPNNRNDAIQRVYDIQTNHGADQTFQALWATWAKQSLKDQNAIAIGTHFF